MIKEEQVLAIGMTSGTNPSMKPDPNMQQLQAITNLTNVMQYIALVLIDIRDGKKDPERK